MHDPASCVCMGVDLTECCVSLDSGGLPSVTHPSDIDIVDLVEHFSLMC